LNLNSVSGPESLTVPALGDVIVPSTVQQLRVGFPDVGGKILAFESNIHNPIDCISIDHLSLSPSRYVLCIFTAQAFPEPSLRKTQSDNGVPTEYVKYVTAAKSVVLATMRIDAVGMMYFFIEKDENYD
jgi:hypothetical protein